MTVWLSLIAILAGATTAFAQAPDPPQNLTHVVAGTTVTLSWTAPPGVSPTSYLVEASVNPGGPLVATLQVSGTSLTVPNVPPGVYYVHVRALNGALRSGPSNVVAVTVVNPCPAPPQPPQLIVRATGLFVTLNWGSSGGCPATSYVVVAGSTPGAADIAVANMGAATALSVNAPPRTYYARVIAFNAYGHAFSEERALSVALNAFTGTIQPFDAQSFDITLSSTGTFEGTLRWEDASIDLDLYIATTACGYPPTGCVLAVSDQSSGNVEQVSIPVAAGSSYRLWIDNFTDRTTSFTITNVVR